MFPRLWASAEPIRDRRAWATSRSSRGWRWRCGRAARCSARSGWHRATGRWTPRPSRLLADAAPLAALQLVRQRARRDFAAQRREQALAALLAGEDAALAPAALDLAADAAAAASSRSSRSRPRRPRTPRWSGATPRRTGRPVVRLVARRGRARLAGRPALPAAAGGAGRRRRGPGRAPGGRARRARRTSLGVAVRVGVGTVGRARRTPRSSRAEADRDVRVLRGRARERRPGAVATYERGARARAARGAGRPRGRAAAPARGAADRPRAARRRARQRLRRHGARLPRGVRRRAPGGGVARGPPQHVPLPPAPLGRGQRPGPARPRRAPDHRAAAAGARTSSRRACAACATTALVGTVATS